MAPMAIWASRYVRPWSQHRDIWNNKKITKYTFKLLKPTVYINILQLWYNDGIWWHAVNSGNLLSTKKSWFYREIYFVYMIYAFCLFKQILLFDFFLTCHVTIPCIFKQASILFLAEFVIWLSPFNSNTELMKRMFITGLNRFKMCI